MENGHSACCLARSKFLIILSEERLISKPAWFGYDIRINTTPKFKGKYQLSIPDREFCNFVVDSTKGHNSEDCSFTDFTEKLLRKLATLYVDHLLPEVLTRHIQDAPTDCVNSTQLCTVFAKMVSMAIRSP